MNLAGPFEDAALARARRLHAQAVESYAAARPARACRLAERALHAVESIPGLDPDGRADNGVAELRIRVVITLALSRSELEGIDAGVALLDIAADAADRMGRPALQVLVRSQRGALALRAGDFRTASRDYAGARELLEHAGPVDQGVILANAATAHLYLGEFRPARGLFERAIAIAQRGGFPRQEAMARHNLGYVEFLRGDLPLALRQMEAAVALTPELPEGVPLLDRARVLAEAGLHRDADTCLAGAAARFRSGGLAHLLGETEIERSRVALLSGDVAGARRFAATARDRFRRRDNPRWRRVAELALVQADLAAHRPASRLVPPALRLRDEFLSEGLRLPARSAMLIAAEASAGAGDPHTAADLLAGVGTPRRADPITARLHYDHVRALVDSQRGNSTAATRRIRRALNDLADYQASFGSIDLRTAAAIHGRQLAQLDITLARRGGRVDSVFAAAERARAATSRLPSVRPPDDPVAAELLAELRQTIEALRAAEHDRGAAAPLLRARHELERAIVARTWATAGGGHAAHPATLPDVRAELARRGRTMVTYVQAGDTLAAVLVGGQGRLVDLGPAPAVIETVRRCRADLDVLASPRLPDPMRAAVRSSLDRGLLALDTALLAPLRLVGEPLVIVSTGVLGQLPWASLPSLRGVPVVVAPSATKWLASTVRRRSQARISALAGPDLGRGIEETRAVAAAWPAANAIVGADRSDLLAGLAGADLLHVAAHGLHQSENPLFSSLRMTDGPLFAHELSGRTPGHVVLSACELGLATVRPGDEALGLASVLLHLGTSSVVASVARVNDDQAARIMLDYHRRLAGGADSAAALADALAADDNDLVAPFVNFGSAWRPGGFGSRRGARVP